MFKNTILIKIIALILIPAFLATEFAYAAPNLAERSTLAPRSMTQAVREMLEDGSVSAKTLREGMGLLGSVASGRRPRADELKEIYGRSAADFNERWVARVVEEVAKKWAAKLAAKKIDFTEADIQ